ncbi:L,D-transpeptidase, partial [Yersinia enterocolitica]|nr:L,D-transpeptidase [Yersinia enterocolitica]
QIINEPVKYSVEPDGKRYVEVHQPLSRVDSDDPQTMPIAISSSLQKFINDSQTDAQVVQEAIVRRAGMPVIVTVGETAPVQAPAAVAPQSEQQAQPQSEGQQPTEQEIPKLVQPGPVYSAAN